MFGVICNAGAQKPPRNVFYVTKGVSASPTMLAVGSDGCAPVASTKPYLAVSSRRKPVAASTQTERVLASVNAALPATCPRGGILAWCAKGKAGGLK